MGYILPIRYLDSEQYLSRMKKNQPAISTVTKLEPTYLHKQRFTALMEKNTMPATLIKGEEKTKKYISNEEKIAELTGKGLHVNEMI